MVNHNHTQAQGIRETAQTPQSTDRSHTETRDKTMCAVIAMTLGMGTSFRGASIGQLSGAGASIELSSVSHPSLLLGTYS